MPLGDLRDLRGDLRDPRGDLRDLCKAPRSPPETMGIAWKKIWATLLPLGDLRDPPGDLRDPLGTLGTLVGTLGTLAGT